MRLVTQTITNLVQRVNLDSGLGDARKSALGTLTSAAETTDSTGIIGNIVLALALELGLEVLEEGVVKVFTAKMGVTSSSFDGKDTARDVEERDIESSSTQVEDQDILLLLGLLVQAIGNGSSGGLVDDTEDLETSNRTSILGGQTLRVVEVGRDTEWTGKKPCV